MSNYLVTALCCCIAPAVETHACCFENFTCDDLSIEECEALGGVSQLGLDCADIDCLPVCPAFNCINCPDTLLIALEDYPVRISSGAVDVWNSVVILLHRVSPGACNWGGAVAGTGLVELITQNIDRYTDEPDCELIGPVTETLTYCQLTCYSPPDDQLPDVWNLSVQMAAQGQSPKTACLKRFAVESCPFGLYSLCSPPISDCNGLPGGCTNPHEGCFDLIPVAEVFAS